MKAYLESLLPKLKRYSARLDDLSLFVDQPWIRIEDNGSRTVYVFRKDGELLIAKDGDVSSGKWSYLDYMDALLLQNSQEERKLYNCGFLDGAVMALKKDGQEEYMLLANENRLKEQTLERVIRQLNRRYLSSPDKSSEVQVTSAHAGVTTPDQLSEEDLERHERQKQFILFILFMLLGLFLMLVIIIIATAS